MEERLTTLDLQLSFFVEFRGSAAQFAAHFRAKVHLFGNKRASRLFQTLKRVAASTVKRLALSFDGLASKISTLATLILKKAFRLIVGSVALAIKFLIVATLIKKISVYVELDVEFWAVLLALLLGEIG